MVGLGRRVGGRAGGGGLGGKGNPLGPMANPNEKSLFEQATRSCNMQKNIRKRGQGFSGPESRKLSRLQIVEHRG